MQNIHN